MHLRGHSERQCVLHRVNRCGLQQPAPGELVTQVRSGGDLTGDGFGFGDERQRDRGVGVGRLHGQRDHGVGSRHRLLGVDDDQRRRTNRHRVGRDEGQAVLGFESQRGDASALQCLAAEHLLAVVLRPTKPDGNLSHSRHLAQVTSTHRGRARHQRMDSRVEHRGQRVGRREACARAATGDAVQPHSERRAHRRGRQWRPEATRMGHHQPVLLTADLLLGQPGVLAVPDLGVEAVHGLPAAQHAVDDCSARGDAVSRIRVELDGSAVDDREQLLDRHRRDADGDGLHGVSPGGGSASGRHRVDRASRLSRATAVG